MEYIENQKNLQYPGFVQKQNQDTTKIKDLSCPSCKYNNFRGATECMNCGIIFSKVQNGLSYKRVQKIMPQELNVSKSWERVIENYDDDTVHQEFISKCLKASALDFAGHKYSCILEAHQSNETALKYHRQVLALGALASISVQPKQIHNFPKAGTLIFAIGICFSIFLILLGFNVEYYRNLVGIGASTLFFVLSLRFYLNFID